MVVIAVLGDSVLVADKGTFYYEKLWDFKKYLQEVEGKIKVAQLDYLCREFSPKTLLDRNSNISRRCGTPLVLNKVEGNPVNIGRLVINDRDFGDVICLHVLRNLDATSWYEKYTDEDYYWYTKRYGVEPTWKVGMGIPKSILREVCEAVLYFPNLDMVLTMPDCPVDSSLWILQNPEVFCLSYDKIGKISRWNMVYYLNGKIHSFNESESERSCLYYLIRYLDRNSEILIRRIRKDGRVCYKGGIRLVDDEYYEDNCGEVDRAIKEFNTGKKENTKFRILDEGKGRFGGSAFILLEYSSADRKENELKSKTYFSFDKSNRLSII